MLLAGLGWTPSSPSPRGPPEVRATGGYSLLIRKPCPSAIRERPSRLEVLLTGLASGTTCRPAPSAGTPEFSATELMTSWRKASCRFPGLEVRAGSCPRWRSIPCWPSWGWKRTGTHPRPARLAGPARRSPPKPIGGWLPAPAGLPGRGGGAGPPLPGLELGRLAAASPERGRRCRSCTAGGGGKPLAWAARSTCVSAPPTGTWWTSNRPALPGRKVRRAAGPVRPGLRAVEQPPSGSWFPAARQVPRARRLGLAGPVRRPAAGALRPRCPEPS
jgi:hypothetical protein